MPDDQSTPAAGGRPSRVRHFAKKALSLVIAGLLMGLAYDWASGRLYRPESVAGMGRGAVHGALMPVALPSLLLGKDVPIYAPNNDGRPYKLGYIAGINLCGLLFFGLAFRRPRQQSQLR